MVRAEVVSSDRWPGVWNAGFLLAFFTSSAYVIGCLVAFVISILGVEGLAVMSYFDSSEDELRDEEYLDEEDDNWDNDDEAETFACPACGADVYEESQRCPECGEYISQSTGPLAGRSTAFVILGIAGIVATIWALVKLF